MSLRSIFKSGITAGVRRIKPDPSLVNSQRPPLFSVRRLTDEENKSTKERVEAITGEKAEVNGFEIEIDSRVVLASAIILAFVFW